MKLFAVATCILGACVVAVDSETILPPKIPMHLLRHNLPAIYNSLEEILGGLIQNTTDCLNAEQEFVNSQQNCENKRGLELDERHVEKRMPMHNMEFKVLVVNLYYNAYRQQEFLRACMNRLANLRGEQRVDVTTQTAGTTMTETVPSSTPPTPTIVTDVPTTTVTDVPTTIVTDVLTTVVTDVPTTVVANVPTTVFIDVPTTVVTDVPTTVSPPLP